MKSGYLSITTVGDYEELLELTPDPGKVFYIRDIIYAYDAGVTDPQPVINLSINGTPFLKDTPIIASSGSLGFGGHLQMFDSHKPLIIQVKTTQTGTLRIVAYVTGIKCDCEQSMS